MILYHIFLLMTVSFKRFRKILHLGLYRVILGGKVNILGGDSIGSCEKRFHMNKYVILIVYRNGAV